MSSDDPHYQYPGQDVPANVRASVPIMEDELSEQQLREIYDNEEIERFLHLFSAVRNVTQDPLPHLYPICSMLQKCVSLKPLQTTRPSLLHVTRPQRANLRTSINLFKVTVLK